MKKFELGTVVYYPKDYRNTSCTGEITGEHFKETIERLFPYLAAPLEEVEGWNRKSSMMAQAVYHKKVTLPGEKEKRPSTYFYNKGYICVKEAGITTTGLLYGIHDFGHKEYTIDAIGVDAIFDDDFGLVEAKSLLKEIQKEKKGLLKKLELEQKENLSKQEKQQLNTLPVLKKVFLSTKLKVEFISSYFAEENEFFNQKLKEEKERAWNFLNNEEEANAAGWNYTGDKKSVIKENERKQVEWCNKAYPNINPDVWLAEFEEMILITYLKSLA